MRKIIAITSASVPNTYHTQCNVLIYALCDDGTVWECSDTRPDWVLMNSIPQPQEDGRTE